MDSQVIYGLGIILAYLAGSISSSILIARCLQLPDPRSLGSGNAAHRQQEGRRIYFTRRFT